jgi:hypothetical protein
MRLQALFGCQESFEALLEKIHGALDGGLSVDIVVPHEDGDEAICLSGSLG